MRRPQGIYRVSKKQQLDMRKRRRAGESVESIAASLGIHPRTVTVHLGVMDLPARLRFRGRTGPSLRAEMRRRWASGETREAIAKQLHCHQSTVWEFTKDMLFDGNGRRRSWIRLTEETRAEARRRAADGESAESIAAWLKCCTSTVYRVVMSKADRAILARRKSPQRLSMDERESILLGIRKSLSFLQIATHLSRAPSSISREVGGRKERGSYGAWKSEKQAAERARRPKQRKLEGPSPLRDEVVACLNRKWSPEQISRHLKKKFPETPSMHVSHETIYQTLYVQGRGTLRAELKKWLRTGRTRRRPQKRTTGRGKIKDMTMISERPPEATDRPVPGNWEGDLIMGKANRSSIATLVERRSRYVMLVRMPKRRTVEDVRIALAAAILRLPEHLRRSLTWDQGKEMAGHSKLTMDTGLKVYFCDPHSPWQRGSNENTNGLLRQYFPKGQDLSGYTQEDLDAVAAELNGRPRETLGWCNPAEVFSQKIAMTA